MRAVSRRRAAATDTEIAPLLDNSRRIGASNSATIRSIGTLRVFMRTIAFRTLPPRYKRADRVGELAEQQQHHPDLHVSWGRLGVEIWTHKIGGLTESDFIFAAKCDALLEASSGARE